MAEDMEEGVSERRDFVCDQLMQVDQVTNVILRGHLLIEEAMEGILEGAAHNKKYIEEARLTFGQKLSLCRAIALDDKHQLWIVIEKINALRNKLSHTLDTQLRAKKISELKAVALQVEFLEAGIKKAGSDEHAICTLVMAGALGFIDRAHREMREEVKG